MPNLGRVLRDEFARLCRREIRKQIAALQRASSAYRRDIAALKRGQTSLERVANGWIKRLQKTAEAPKAEEPQIAHRFRADGFRSLRNKLGLSAVQMGVLLGVSGQSVYAWEQKRSTPRRSQLAGIAAVRSMGKREAIARLEGRAAASRKPQRKRTRSGEK